MITQVIALPSGREISLCAECSEAPPRHQYFCSEVHSYSREQILREMIAIENTVAHLAAAAKRLRAMRCPAAAEDVEQDISIERQPFWEWAHWLGLEFWSSTDEERRAIRAELQLLRDRDAGRARDRIPPWRRRGAA